MLGLSIPVFIILPQKQKILNQKFEISEKLKDFERTGNRWLEPAPARRETETLQIGYVL